MASTLQRAQSTAPTLHLPPAAVARVGAEADEQALRHHERLARVSLAHLLVSTGAPVAWEDVGRRAARCGLDPIAAAAALERLAERGETERLPDGRWRFRPF